MRILLKEITDQERLYNISYKLSDLNLSSNDVLSLKDINAIIKAKRYSDNLFVSVDYSSCLELKCARCLEKFEYNFKNNVELEYNISKDQEFVDITDDLRQEIIINYPQKPLCRKDCHGLCCVCGNNLNVSKCNCSRKEHFNPFSKLNNKK